MIARGFDANGKYRSESKLTDAEKKAGGLLHHTAIKTGFDTKAGTVTAVGQNYQADKSLQAESHPVAQEGWFVVRSEEQFDTRRSEGVIMPAKVPEKAGPR